METYDDFVQFMSTDNFKPSRSPVKKSLQQLCGKWKPLVIYELGHRERTDFYQLRAAIPTITNTILTSTLAELMDLSIVALCMPRKDEQEMQYSLTQKGKDLLPAFYELYKWGKKYPDG